MSSLVSSTGVQLAHTVNGRPAISSKDVALHFQRKHKEILRDIERIRSMLPKDFNERNFALISISTDLGHATRQDPAYLLTRDAFSLLAMGFTGKAALLWKLRYIEAFNALEAAALDALRGRVASALSLTPLTAQRVKALLRYRERGFSQRETAAVMGLHRRTVQGLEKTARELGLEERHAALPR